MRDEGVAMDRYYARRSMLAPERQQCDSGWIGVVAAPDDSRRIGIARRVGSTLDGQASYRLEVGSRVLPGLWVLVDQEFRPAG